MCVLSKPVSWSAIMLSWGDTTTPHPPATWSSSTYTSACCRPRKGLHHTHTHTHTCKTHTHTHTHTHTCTHTKKHVANCLCAQNTCVLCIFIFNFKFEYYCAWIFFRQLTNSRERIATGLKKILETNELVTNMEVLQYTCMLKLYEAFSTRLSWRN